MSNKRTWTTNPAEVAAGNAITVVARQVLHDLVEAVELDWGEYPDLGEHDWVAVVAAVDRLVPAPPEDVFQGAYELLSKRANAEEAL